MDYHVNNGAKGAGVANFAFGVTSELAKQGGAAWASNLHTRGLASAAGQSAVQGVANVAPGAIAAVGAAVAAMPAVVAAIAVPAVLVGAGYGAYKLVKWLTRD